MRAVFTDLAVEPRGEHLEWEYRYNRLPADAEVRSSSANCHFRSVAAQDLGSPSVACAQRRVGPRSASVDGRGISLAIGRLDDWSLSPHNTRVGITMPLRCPSSGIGHRRRAGVAMQHQVGLSVASLFYGQLDGADTCHLEGLGGRLCSRCHVHAPLRLTQCCPTEGGRMRRSLWFPQSNW